MTVDLIYSILSSNTTNLLWNQKHPKYWSKDDTREWLEKMKETYKFNDDLVDLELEGSVLLQVTIDCFERRTPNGYLVFYELRGCVEEFTPQIRIFTRQTDENRELILNLGLEDSLLRAGGRGNVTDQQMDVIHRDVENELDNNNIDEFDIILERFQPGISWMSIQIHLKLLYNFLAIGIWKRDEPHLPFDQTPTSGDYVVIEPKKTKFIIKYTSFYKKITRQFEISVLENEDRWKSYNRQVEINSKSIVNGGVYTLCVPWNELFGFLIDSLGHSQQILPEPSQATVEHYTSVWSKIHSSLGPLVKENGESFLEKKSQNTQRHRSIRTFCKDRYPYHALVDDDLNQHD
ncbi:hypothetical protein DFA_07184 [Cavenderia fasciculata]|uniref:PNT domain-containing protein n=1 Tax=Cavenderia fasciculata TaxID=261658 RepID=F4PVQ3_CACFS|nr:uncharacterized protein DFA_07184 [Cavenderia fasciculata]EGG20067.1 hypothetical protein DFA_07184 [Cavenderia fasciculata]|eukprot:XP_004367050.1 hypothetical protein DFA_07184 [Cavenderia fasciculata]